MTTFDSLCRNDQFTLDGIRRCKKTASVLYECGTVYSISPEAEVIPFLTHEVKTSSIREGDSFIVGDIIVTCMAEELRSPFLPTTVEKITW
jgi:hypothetical protein